MVDLEQKFVEIFTRSHEVHNHQFSHYHPSPTDSTLVKTLKAQDQLQQLSFTFINNYNICFKHFTT